MKDSTLSNYRPSRRTILKSGVAMSSIGLAGCLGGDGGGGGGETLKIGALFPTSGPYAETGGGQEAALEYSVEQFDGSVADLEIETSIRDSGTDPGTATQRSNEFIQEEDIDILVGGFSSSVCLAMQEVAGREEIPYFSGGGSTLKANGENCNKYSFFSMASGWQYSGAGVAAHEEGITDSLFFVQADYEGGEGVYDGVTAVLEDETEVDLMGRELVPLGADDYSSAISAARDSGADTVWAATVGADTIRFVEQAVSADLDQEMTILIGVVGNSVAEALGSETTGNIYGGANFYWTAEGSREFSDDYINSVGSPPEWWSAVTVDASMEALTAVDEVGSANPDEMINFLEGRSFEWTRTGTQWRECDHRAIQPYHFLGGLTEEERSEEGEYWEIIGRTGGETIMRSCDATGCSL